MNGLIKNFLSTKPHIQQNTLLVGMNVERRLRRNFAVIVIFMEKLSNFWESRKSWHWNFDTWWYLMTSETWYEGELYLCFWEEISGIDEHGQYLV
jgi:hypothetical protein